MKKLVSLIISLLVIVTGLQVQVSRADEFTEDDSYVQVFSPASANAAKAQMPKIDAGAALVMDMKSGRVLFEKNGHTRRPMASTTKIMTAIIAIEKGNLEDVVTVSKRAANIWGSDINLKVGEKLTLKELLYGLMLKSGNDAAIAIAEHIGDTVENFCDMMTKKAADLGAKNTNFKSPHGLDAPDHYTTAYELALITRYALSNSTFCKIVSTTDASISNRSLHNTNEMLGAYPGTDGVKTGYTGQAGRCLVTSATRNNWRLISVVLGAPSRNARAQTSRNVLDYGFNNYKQHTLLKAGETIKTIPVIRGIRASVPVQSVDDIVLPLRQDEIDAMETVINLPNSLQAPVLPGIEVGSIKYRINGKDLAESALKTVSEIRRKTFLDYLGDVVKEWGRIIRPGN